MSSTTPSSTMMPHCAWSSCKCALLSFLQLLNGIAPLIFRFFCKELYFHICVTTVKRATFPRYSLPWPTIESTHYRIFLCQTYLCLRKLSVITHALSSYLNKIKIIPGAQCEKFQPKNYLALDCTFLSSLGMFISVPCLVTEKTFLLMYHVAIYICLVLE